MASSSPPGLLWLHHSYGFNLPFQSGQSTIQSISIFKKDFARFFSFTAATFSHI